MFKELRNAFSDRSLAQKLIYIICIGLSVFNLLASSFVRVNYWVHYPMNLLVACAVIFIGALDPKKKARSAFYLALLVMATASIGYFMFNYREMMFRTTFPTGLDTVFGFVCIIVCLLATRKATGNGLFIVTLVFVLYGYLGQYLPQPLGHAGFKFSRLTRMVFGEVGIFGSPLSATATFVFLFCLFGAFLQNFAGGQFFIDLATASAGRFRGGPAKVAVIASALFGTVSGSAIANVATTGAFTIPLMKKTGYSPEFAGAVEAVASTGGQIMPPVMGATAFLMAEITGIPYSQICIAALIPALLFFFSVFIMIDLEAVKLGLRGLEPDAIPDFKKIILQKWPLLAPLVVIILMLLVFKMSASRTAFAGILTTILAPLFVRSVKITPLKIVDALYEGAKSCVGILASCACAGMIIATLAVTGLGVKLGSFLIGLSGGYLVLMLFFTMVITLVLGMGLPTPSAYIVCVSVVGQTLIEVGISPMAAHLFIFYFAILSTVTPPVALSAYTAAAIADCNPNKTGVQGFKLSVVAFIVPYMFVMGPALLTNGTFVQVIQALFTAILGVVCIGAAMEGYLSTKLHMLQRVLLTVCALLLINTELLTDLLGIACFGFALLTIFLQKRRQTVGPA